MYKRHKTLYMTKQNNWRYVVLKYEREHSSSISIIRNSGDIRISSINGIEFRNAIPLRSLGVSNDNDVNICERELLKG